MTFDCALMESIDVNAAAKNMICFSIIGVGWLNRPKYKKEGVFGFNFCRFLLNVSLVKFLECSLMPEFLVQTFEFLLYSKSFNLMCYYFPLSLKKLIFAHSLTIFDTVRHNEVQFQYN